MLHVVVYDVASPERLRKVAKVCELYGLRVEKSVFEAELSEARFQELWGELAAAIDPKADVVIAYPVCEACGKKVAVLGRPPPPPERGMFFV